MLKKFDSQIQKKRSILDLKQKSHRDTYNEIDNIQRKIAREQENKDFIPPKECTFNLSGKIVREKMISLLEKLYNDKVILDHGMEVGKELSLIHI
mgnify:CR=1 FL=1